VSPRSRLLAGAAVLLGLGLGAVHAPTPPAAGPDQGHEDWSLPGVAVLRRHDAGDLQPVLSLRWAGARADAPGDAPAGGEGEGEAQAVTRWTLRGIVRGPSPVALVDVAGESRLRRFALGETLPDEAVIVAIDANAIAVERDGCRTLHPLYRLDAEGAPSCPSGRQDP
jgi:hypothetical protein